jgi:hypothetical protein
MMQAQGAKNNSAEVTTAVMTGPRSCKVGELPLSGTDLLIEEHLLLRIPLGNEQFLEPLKKGDIVAITRLSEDCYAILGRMVSV